MENEGWIPDSTDELLSSFQCLCCEVVTTSATPWLWEKIVGKSSLDIQIGGSRSPGSCMDSMESDFFCLIILFLRLVTVSFSRCARQLNLCAFGWGSKSTWMASRQKHWQQSPLVEALLDFWQFLILGSRHLKLWKLFSDLAWGDDRRTQTKKAPLSTVVCWGCNFQGLSLQEIASRTPKGFQGRAGLWTGCQGKVGFIWGWFSSLVSWHTQGRGYQCKYHWVIIGDMECPSICTVLAYLGPNCLSLCNVLQPPCTYFALA